MLTVCIEEKSSCEAGQKRVYFGKSTVIRRLCVAQTNGLDYQNRSPELCYVVVLPCRLSAYRT
jgi:hypothetical protein